ncbi:MAG TPA: ABC transporter substrate-binding protein [Thermoanaerobaculia bacterium]|nr:ABC transporter substrate-binding protein [Thermoanaerobaculia bacterium]
MSSGNRLLLLLLGTAAVCCTRPAGPGVAEQTPLRKIRVLARAHLSMAPLLIAQEEGYFREQGLDVELFSLASSRDGLPALIKGDLDVLTSSIVPAYLNLIAHGAPIRLVADKGRIGTGGCSYLGFWTRPDAVVSARTLRRRSSRQRWLFSVARGTFYEYLSERFLAGTDIPPDDVDLVDIDGSAEVEGLARGTVDVGLGTESKFLAAAREGLLVEWKSASDVLPGFQFSVLLFGPSLLETDREAGQRFINGYLRGVRQYNQGKTDRNLEILAARTDFDRETLAELCWIPMDADGRINERSLVELMDWGHERGYVDRVLAPEEFWDRRFIDEAARLLGDAVTTQPGASARK